ncbi:hypothetical protein ACU8KH_04362 [Lachancea thermotolerans]
MYLQVSLNFASFPAPLKQTGSADHVIQRNCVSHSNQSTRATDCALRHRGFCGSCEAAGTFARLRNEFFRMQPAEASPVDSGVGQRAGESKRGTLPGVVGSSAGEKASVQETTQCALNFLWQHKRRILGHLTAVSD